MNYREITSNPEYGIVPACSPFSNLQFKIEKEIGMLKKLLVGLIMIMMTASGGQAYDPDPYGGGNWNCTHILGQGDNLTCLGVLTEEEFNSQHFQDALAGNLSYPAIWSPLNMAEMNIIPNQTRVNLRYDNRRFAPPRTPDSRVVLSEGFVDANLIPVVWAIQVDDPGDDCTPDNNWHFNLCPDSPECQANPTDPVCGGIAVTYPAIVYHIDWEMTPEMRAACEPDHWDSSECMNFHGPNPDTPDSDLPLGFLGTAMRTVGGRPMLTSDVTSIQWVEGNEVTTPHYQTTEEWFSRTFDTKKNVLVESGGGSSPTIFIHPFTKQGKMGDQTFIINFANGQQMKFVRNVPSNLVMPTVSTFNDSLTFQKVKIKVKKGEEVIKIVDKERDITVVNLSAREIDGGRLLITWRPTDDVFALPQQSNIRLRVFVGAGWFNKDFAGDGHHEPFLWIDAPLHTGNVVLTQADYEMIKSLMPGNTLEIGGMYREQYSGYHNRGYFEGIQLEF